MSFSSETYRLLIASPSDLPEERQAATDAINEWNVQHAAAEGVVLLPVKWETHAVPEIARRPQEAINRQLVHECDILVGMFWTKLGTATGVAESGHRGRDRPVRDRRKEGHALFLEPPYRSEQN